MRPVPDIAVQFVSQHEGCKLSSYRDSAGIWTVGYGHTGMGIGPNLAISKAKALLYLKDDLETAARRLAERIKVVDELTTHQYAALLSFVFNVGAGPKWTIWRRLNNRQFDQVPIELMKFVNAGGKKLQGLVNRRAAEVMLWSTDEPGSENVSPPSSVTRFVETPPTQGDPVPARREPGLIATAVAAVTTGVTAAVSAAPQAIQQVVAVAQPYADKSTVVANIISGLATVAAVLAILGLVLMWLKKKRAQT